MDRKGRELGCLGCYRVMTTMKERGLRHFYSLGVTVEIRKLTATK